MPPDLSELRDQAPGLIVPAPAAAAASAFHSATNRLERGVDPVAPRPPPRTGTPRLFVLFNDLVDDAVVFRFLGRHDVVALDVALDFFELLAAVPGDQAVDDRAHSQDFASVDVDVRSLSGKPAHPRLVDQDAGVGQGEALLGGAGGEQQGGDRGGLAYADGDHIGPHELHGVVDGHTRGDRPTRRIDVQRDVLLRVFGLQEQQLRRHQVGHVVVYARADKDDVVLQQARIDVVGALAAVGLLDHHGYQSGRARTIDRKSVV